MQNQHPKLIKLTVVGISLMGLSIAAPLLVESLPVVASSTVNSNQIKKITANINRKQLELAKTKNQAAQQKLKQQIKRLKKQLNKAKALQKTIPTSDASVTIIKPTPSSASSAAATASSSPASSSTSAAPESTANYDRLAYGFNFVSGNEVSPQTNFAPGNPDQLEVGDGAWLFSDNNLAIYKNLPAGDPPNSSDEISSPQQFNFKLMLINAIQTNANGIEYAHVTNVSDPNNKIEVGWVILSQLKPATSNANALIRTAGANGVSDAEINDVKQGALDSVNAARTKVGLPKLVEDPQLSTIAKIRSNDIVTNFSHDDANNNSIIEQDLTNFGLLGNNQKYDRYGENISTDLNASDFSYYMIGYQSNYSMTYADAGQSNWGHRANVLNGEFTNIGIGVTYDQKSNQFYTAYEFTGMN
ncbi:CAP domain-containing protein [Lactobacillus sp. Sy-1]|uniref:CAP domain-containing protein n=1 Tax=Lactobacillus sp. Sy-1 TaxID=2109645 RepID=UPI001C5B9D2C|nr:CAP domain-containing protein [Lactobacillus sp. Sy-1]MBW1606132.1 CAP domain-containing protein [Lactobacillus sp. Sy-1]